MIFDKNGPVLPKKEQELIEESTSKSKELRTPRENLESKVESIIRSIENLSGKKFRIEFEIKRQKTALARKREELKRVSKTHSAKVVIRSESQIEDETPKEDPIDLRRTQRLLQESARILEN